jgi:hypothetical protein
LRGPREDHDFGWGPWLCMEDIIGVLASLLPEPCATIEHETTLTCRNRPGLVSLM